MDWFKDVVGSWFPNNYPKNSGIPDLSPPNEVPDIGSGHRHSPHRGVPDLSPPREVPDIGERHGERFHNPPRYEGRADRIPEFHPFSDSPFDEMRRSIEESFQEIYRMFGDHSFPMFDPFVFPENGDGHQEMQSPSGHAPGNSNVRDRMLKGNGETNDADINVRSLMLKDRESNSAERDINWDSALKDGWSVDDILDGKIRSREGSSTQTRKESPQVNSYFSYSHTTRVRKPDGTIETRRVTRDGSGNEKETIEITSA